MNYMPLFSHQSGGEPDVLAVFAGIGLVLAFVGILQILDLGWRRGPTGQKIGWALIAASVVVVIVGAVVVVQQEAARLAHEAEHGAIVDTPADFWIKAILPFMAIAVVSTLGAILAYWWARRSGQFSEAEEAKYLVFDDK